MQNDMIKNPIKVMMIGSDLSVKGGMTTVVENYIKYIDQSKINYKFVPTHIDGSKISKLIFFYIKYFEIKRTFDNFDLFHLHMSERGSFYRKSRLVLYLKSKNKPVIIHHHGPEFLEYYKQASIKLKNRIKKVLKSVDINLVLSNQMANVIKSIEPESKIHVLFNGVKVESINPYRNDGNIILFLGKIGQRKGAYDLLNTIRRIDSQIPERIKFYFCGNGEVNEIKKLIGIYGLEHRIPHVGWISGNEKRIILRSTLINILPSYFEGLPMTILETMALGIPNISTNVNSIPEVISSDRYGFIGEPGDLNFLSSSLINLIKDNMLRKHVSENSFDLIKSKFNIESNIKDLEQIYIKLVGE